MLVYREVYLMLNPLSTMMINSVALHNTRAHDLLHMLTVFRTDIKPVLIVNAFNILEISRSGHTDTVRALLDGGAAAEISDLNGLSPSLPSRALLSA